MYESSDCEAVMSSFFQTIFSQLASSLHLSQIGANLADAALWVGRIGMAVLGILLLIRCCRSLFAGKTEQETWGFLSLSNGTRYDLNHWENVIGRAKSCDVRINFPSVSRSHAALLRDDSGTWYIYPLNAKSGVLLNGQRIFACTEVKQADVIAAGGVEMYFFPASHAIQKQWKPKYKFSGRHHSLQYRRLGPAPHNRWPVLPSVHLQKTDHCAACAT